MTTPQIVRRPLLIAGSDPSELLEPVDAPLRPASEAVDLTVEPRRSTPASAFRLPRFPLVLPLGNHVSDPPAAQQAAALRIAIALIQGHLARSLPRSAARARNADAIQHGF